MERVHYVYILACGEQPKVFYKFGVTSGPKHWHAWTGTKSAVSKRISGLQVGNPLKITAVGILPALELAHGIGFIGGDSRVAAFYAEKALHARVIDEHVLGEWFSGPTASRIAAASQLRFKHSKYSPLARVLDVLNPRQGPALPSSFNRFPYYQLSA